MLPRRSTIPQPISIFSVTVMGYNQFFDDKMAVAVYMLFQDRIDESIRIYKEVHPARLRMAIQYDYMSAYMSFYEGAPDKAKAIALKYKDYPVDRWNNLFNEILTQSDEISGRNAVVMDEENRAQAQAMLADTMPRLQLDREGNSIKMEYANLKECVINYYPMNIELLFSRKPFVQDVGTQFTFIKPSYSERLSASFGILFPSLSDVGQKSNYLFR
jgi:hypothetical protein